MKKELPIEKRKGTIAHFLNKPEVKSDIDAIAFNPTECKKRVIDYLKKGVESKEITDVEEVNKVIPIIEKVRANQFYSIYAALFTGMIVGKDGMGGK